MATTTSVVLVHVLGDSTSLRLVDAALMDPKRNLCANAAKDSISGRNTTASARVSRNAQPDSGGWTK